MSGIGLGLSLAAAKFLEGYTTAAKKNQQDKQKLEQELKKKEGDAITAANKRLTTLSKAPDGSPLKDWVVEQQRNLAIDQNYVVDFSQASTLSGQAPEQQYTQTKTDSMKGVQPRQFTKGGEDIAHPLGFEGSAESSDTVKQRVIAINQEIEKKKQIRDIKQKALNLENQDVTDARRSIAEIKTELSSQLKQMEQLHKITEATKGKDKELLQRMYAFSTSIVPKDMNVKDYTRLATLLALYKTVIGRDYKPGLDWGKNDAVVKQAYDDQIKIDSTTGKAKVLTEYEDYSLKKDILDKELGEQKISANEVKSILDEIEQLQLSPYNVPLSTNPKVNQ